MTKCSFISPKKAIETYHYPAYVIRLQEEGQRHQNEKF